MSVLKFNVQRCPHRHLIRACITCGISAANHRPCLCQDFRDNVCKSCRTLVTDEMVDCATCRKQHRPGDCNIKTHR